MKITESQLRGMIREAVIDASDRFKKKRQDDLSAKIDHLVNDFPITFKELELQEAELNSELLSLGEEVDGIVSQKRMRMACPIAFDPVDGWGPNATVLDVLSVAHEYNSEEWRQLKEFVMQNSSAFESAIQRLRSRLTEIEQAADKKGWAAPWRRYTKWPEVSSMVNRFVDNVKKMAR